MASIKKHLRSAGRGARKASGATLRAGKAGAKNIQERRRLGAAIKTQKAKNEKAKLRQAKKRAASRRAPSNFKQPVSHTTRHTHRAGTRRHSHR